MHPPLHLPKRHEPGAMADLCLDFCVPQTVDFLYKNFAHLMGKNLFDVRVNAPEVFGTDTGSM